MCEIQEALKMMSDGFALMTKGLATVLEQAAAATVTTESNPTVNDENTRTCTLVEAAKMLGMGRSSVDRRCNAGELEYIQDPRSGYRRIVVQSIRAYHRRMKEATMQMREAA